MWALKSPDGVFIGCTADEERGRAWEKSFWYLAWIWQDEGWEKRYWKRLADSQRSARRRGWRLVKVKMVEA